MIFSVQEWMKETRAIILEFRQIEKTLVRHNKSVKNAYQYSSSERKVLLKNIIKRRRVAEYMFEQIPNRKMRKVLKKYYLDCLTWECVAEDLGCSVRWVYILHKRALPMLENIFINHETFFK